MKQGKHTCIDFTNYIKGGQNMLVTFSLASAAVVGLAKLDDLEIVNPIISHGLLGLGTLYLLQKILADISTSIGTTFLLF